MQGTEYDMQRVSARDLWEALGVSKDFTDWMKAQIVRAKLVDGLDYIVMETLSTPEKASAKARPQKRTEYVLSINAAKELCMLSNCEKGKAAERLVIPCGLVEG